jgi:cytochrome c-type biogenesis protein CcmE
VLNAFQSNLVFFYSPTQVAPTRRRGPHLPPRRLVEGQRQARRRDVRFVVTDTAKTVPVRYRGILPDLFKEGKGVVAQGKLEATASSSPREVLAKHDENYMPPEAADALSEGAQAARCRARARWCRAAHGCGARHDSRTRALRAVAGAVRGAGCWRGAAVGAARGRAAWMALARPAAQAQFVFVAMSPSAA